MKLRLFTQPRCPKCSDAKKIVEAVAQQRTDLVVEYIDISIEENLLTALMLQIASTPSFVLDDTPIFMENISINELNSKIDEYKQKQQYD